VVLFYILQKEVIMYLLEADVHSKTIHSMNAYGAVPLHNACDAHFSTESDAIGVIQLLLDSDHDKKTIYYRTSDGDLPIHYACWRIQPFEVIKTLLEMDTKGSTIFTRNCHGRVPLQTACHRNAPPNILNLLLEYGKKDTEYVWGAFLTPCDNMGTVVSNSRKCQDIIVDKLPRRLPIFILMTDFYVHCIQIGSFLQVSHIFLHQYQQSNLFPFVLFVGSVIYFTFREILQLISERGNYFRKGWNIVDASVIIFSITSCIMVQDFDNRNYSSVRNLIAVTGAFIFMGMMSYLRATFLPYARFTNGMLRIFWKLVPFFVVSVLLLAAFSHMYFAIEYDESFCSLESACSDRYEICMCSFWSVFPGVFTFIVRGMDGAATIIDYLFGVVIGIVLLNVLIAIVNDEWNKSSDEMVDAFWNYRLGFLAEIQILPSWNHLEFSIITSLDRFGWTEKHSNGLLVYRKDYQWTDGSLWDRAKFICIFIPAYSILFLLGFLTCGLLWPKEIRCRVIKAEGKQNSMNLQKQDDLKRNLELQTRYINAYLDLIIEDDIKSWKDVGQVLFDLHANVKKGNLVSKSGEMNSTVVESMSRIVHTQQEVLESFRTRFRGFLREDSALGSTK